MFLLAATNTLGQPFSEQLALPEFLVMVATLVAAIAVPIWLDRRKNRNVEKLLQQTRASVAQLSREVDRLRDALETLAPTLGPEAPRTRRRRRRRPARARRRT